MISVDNELYTKLKTTLSASFPNIKMSSVFTNTPSSYPFVSLEEIENVIYERGMDCCEIENFVNVSYEIVVFVENQNTKKTDANKIAKVADEFMLGLGFIRETKYSRQNDNETDYRIYLRYSAVVSKNKEIYRR